MDAELNAAMRLTSANSINVARFLPQSFYYFWGYAQMKKLGLADNLVVCTPSGNFGNICAGLFAKRMGLPVKRFIAANNANSVFYDYLRTGVYSPRPSIQTIANADISGTTYSDAQIMETIKDVYGRTGYLCDPHGACGYRALAEGLRPGEAGLFCETAHPAKFKDTVAGIIGTPVAIPEKLQAFMRGRKENVSLPNDYQAFKAFLTGR